MGWDMEAQSVGQGELASKISVAVARKANDVARDQGEAAVKLLEGAVKLAREAARGAVEEGKGIRVDVEG